MKKSHINRPSLRLEDFNSVARKRCVEKFNGNPIKYLRSIGYAI